MCMIKKKKDGRKRKKRRWFTGLSPRRRKLIENLLSGKYKTKKDLMLSAGYAESTALKSAKVTIGNNRNLTSIQLAMEEMGITDFRLARIIRDGLDANKV